MLTQDQIINNVSFIGAITEVPHADALKKLCLDLKHHLHDHLIVLCSNIGGKAYVAIGISDTVAEAKQLDAGKLIKDTVGPMIKGGGGGQKSIATAGGQDVSQFNNVIDAIKLLIS